MSKFSLNISLKEVWQQVDIVLISLVKTPNVIMTDFSLLTTFWPLVKFYQITGCFPLEKTEGQYFRPMGTWKYLLRYFITCIIGYTALIISVLPMGFIEVLKIEANFTTSLIDLGAFLFSILAMIGLHLSLIWRNVVSKVI